MKMRVLIVEDEPLAQSELKRLLAACEHEVHVLECIDSIEEAVEWLEANPAPDLMFFDIRLSDGLSFEIFRQVNTKAPVIFTTAYDEYAIQAFKVHSIDYLLKPVKQADLNAALEKFKSLFNSGKPLETGLDLQQLEKLFSIEKPTYKSRFITRIGDQILRINVEDVGYFKAEDNEVLLVTNSNKRYFVNHTLDQLNGLLDPNLFYRVNRSYVVGIKSIGKISKYFNSRLHLELTPPADEPVLISRVKVPDFLNWIDK